MADSNNYLAGRIPAHPYEALKTLEPLIGTWSVGGNFVSGEVRFEWSQGSYFLVQHVSLQHDNKKIVGVEYIGFDEDTQTLRSHYMDNHGSNFAYTWEVTGQTIRTWFGEKDSDNFFEGKFADDMGSYSGDWHWPNGGYHAVMKRKPSLA